MQPTASKRPPTGKRRLSTAHTHNGHFGLEMITSKADIHPGTHPQRIRRQSQGAKIKQDLCNKPRPIGHDAAGIL
jgi:hypothetical protein